VNALFLAGVVLAPCLRWGCLRTRWGLILRTVGESAEAARAMGYDVNRVRLWATVAGGVLAGIGGSFSRCSIRAATTRVCRAGKG
jgi:simple sugar transport system permease protein